MKKKKLSLTELEVNSFVTELKETRSDTVKGAGGDTIELPSAGNYPCQTEGGCSQTPRTCLTWFTRPNYCR
ncbi:MAG: pinensin family lanthipeptide [Bacteroidota bacterium]